MLEMQSNPLNQKQQADESLEPAFVWEALKIGKHESWTAMLEPVKELANDFWYQKQF